MQVRYVGPFDAVDVPVPGEVHMRTVKRGETLSLADEAFARSLCEQETWEAVRPAPAARGPKEGE